MILNFGMLQVGGNGIFTAQVVWCHCAIAHLRGCTAASPSQTGQKAFNTLLNTVRHRCTFSSATSLCFQTNSADTSFGFLSSTSSSSYFFLFICWKIKLFVHLRKSR